MDGGDFDAIVIGAGIGGLVTGAILSNNGCRVLLIEKGRLPGGRLAVVQDGDFGYPTGPHSFPRETIDTAYGRAGVTAELFERRGGYRMYTLPTKRHYSLLKGEEEWKTKMEKFNLSQEDGEQISSAMKSIDPETWQGKTAARWTREMGFSSRVQRIMADSCSWGTDGTLTADVISMDVFPMGVFALFVGEVPGTEFCSDQRINTAFCEKVAAAGRVEFGAEAVRIEIEEGSVRGVLYRRSDDGSLWRARAPVIVSNTPILEMWRKKVFVENELPESLRANARALEEMEPYLGGYITHWYGLREPISDSVDSVCMFDEQAETKTHTVAKAYLRVHSNAVPTLAAQGKQLVDIVYLLPPHERGSLKVITERAAWVDSLARDYVRGQGWKPLEETVEIQKTIVSYHAWGAYNWSVFRPYLPEVAVPDIAGLYFVGNMVQSTPGLYGVAGAADTGIRCADLILA